MEMKEMLDFGRSTKRSIRPKHLLILILILSLAFLFPSLVVQRPVQAQTTFQNITSFRVTGAANFSAPGAESFWSAIPWTDVSLAASVSPGGGHTNQMLVKSANDGFEVYMLLKLTATQSQSYTSAK